MGRAGGLVTRADLKAYRAVVREPLEGTYRGYEVLSAPPPSSGGVVLLQALNVLEGYDLAQAGFGSADAVHFTAEAMRRAFADRARYLGDPAFNPDMPVARLVSKEYAEALRRGIRPDRASVSSPTTFEWPAESAQTTHVSVVDADLRRRLPHLHPGGELRGEDRGARARASCSTTRWATSTRARGTPTTPA